MALFYSLFLAGGVAIATPPQVVDNVVCDVIDNSHAILPARGRIGAKPASTADILPSNAHNSPTPAPSHRAAVDAVDQESSAPVKLSVFGQNTVEHRLKDTRFSVVVAHYTGTVQILLNDRIKNAWLVKATTPDQKFTGLNLESEKPSLAVICEAGVINTDAKSKKD